MRSKSDRMYWNRQRKAKAAAHQSKSNRTVKPTTATAISTGQPGGEQPNLSESHRSPSMASNAITTRPGVRWNQRTCGGVVSSMMAIIADSGLAHSSCDTCDGCRSVFLESSVLSYLSTETPITRPAMRRIHVFSTSDRWPFCVPTIAAPASSPCSVPARPSAACRSRCTRSAASCPARGPGNT